MLLSLDDPIAATYIAQVQKQVHWRETRDEVIGYAKKMYISVSLDENGDLVAFGTAAVYDGSSCFRNDQWEFGANRDRWLWIDFVWSKKKKCGYGRATLKELESALRNHVSEVPKANVYVMAIRGKGDFYKKCGYTFIATDNHPDDEDYPTSFVDGTCEGLWLAKPLCGGDGDGDKPRGEKDYVFRLVTAATHRVRSLYAKFFTKNFEAERLHRCVEKNVWDEEIFDAAIDEEASWVVST
jgi:hypothetical protein